MKTQPSPRVSVIIPAYNGQQFIGQAIESVLAQTYQNLEIIVADDGSTDDTRAQLERFGDRVTTLALAHRGVCAARNAAIGASHGEFIALLDSDDIWEPNKLELQVAYLDTHPDVALVYAYSTNFTDEAAGNVALVKKVDFEGFIFKDLFTKNSFANSTILLRRPVFDAVGGYDESLTAMEDYELNLRISRAYPIGRVPVSLLRRRIHPASFYSSGYDNQYVYQLPVYGKYMAEPAVEQLIGLSREAFLSSFILKFIFKNLYDGREEFIAQKLHDLERYAPAKVGTARRLVDAHDVSPESWRPLVHEFDAWHQDVKHKAALYARR